MRPRSWTDPTHALFESSLPPSYLQPQLQSPKKASTTMMLINLPVTTPLQMDDAPNDLETADKQIHPVDLAFQKPSKAVYLNVPLCAQLMPPSI
jgi:hypothetical protein